MFLARVSCVARRTCRATIFLVHFLLVFFDWTRIMLVFNWADNKFLQILISRKIFASLKLCEKTAAE